MIDHGGSVRSGSDSSGQSDSRHGRTPVSPSTGRGPASTVADQIRKIRGRHSKSVTTFRLRWSRGTGLSSAAWIRAVPPPPGPAGPYPPPGGQPYASGPTGQPGPGPGVRRASGLRCRAHGRRGAGALAAGFTRPGGGRTDVPCLRRGTCPRRHRAWASGAGRADAVPAQQRPVLPPVRDGRGP